MAVYVLMPAFNEAAKIGVLLDEIPSDVDGEAVEVVVIDDGSDDGTSDIVRKAGHTVLRQSHNQGKGAALCRGVVEIQHMPIDAVLWMDSDGQHLPSSIPDLVRPVLRGDVDLCVGSRYLGENSQHAGRGHGDRRHGVRGSGNWGHKAPFNRRLVRRATIAAMRGATGFPLTDPFSGFRCFSRRAFEVLALRGCGYESELESCFSVARAGLTYGEVPIPRIYGPDMSKMGHRHGAIRGRLKVVSGYARTIARETLLPAQPPRVVVSG